MKYLLIILLGLSLNGFSQTVFVRQNVISTVYYSIDSLFTNAQDGDTLYLPGGVFTINNLIIDNKLSIIGTGHHPDSTAATYATTLNGNIFVLNTASFGTLSGIYLTGSIHFGTNVSNQTVTNYTINRCNVTNIEMSNQYYAAGTASYIEVSQNIIRSLIRGGNAQFVSIRNNLFQGSVEFFNGNVLIQNNTFLGGNGCPSYHMTELNSVLFENNVFMNNGSCSNATISGATSCIFQKNVFNANYSFPVGSNIGIGNYVNIPMNTFFLNQSNYSIEYSDDFHLNDPLTYLGIDGTQAGIYGGAFPYKEGAVPKNPHIITKTVAPQTTPTGDLNISIKVGAQNN